MSLEEMRLSYTRGSLDISDVNSDPMVQFLAWFHQAKESAPDWFEPNAMTLSTTNGAGELSSRVVLLKGIDGGQLFFYTNYGSTKGQQIHACSAVSLCFFWPHLQRQVRIQGNATKTSREQSEAYFGKRPRDSQLGALASQQSAEVESRSWLEDRMTDLSNSLRNKDVPCPENWGGYSVSPNMIEFWQGRESRLHDRIVYRGRAGQGSGWELVRLSP